jgi:hypothetical protein
MGEDDDDIKDNDSEDNGNKMTTTARMTGEDGEDNRRGRGRRQGGQH